MTVRTARSRSSTHGDGWRVNGEDFDQVVNTIALNLLPDIVEGIPSGVAEAMRGLSYNSITTFLLALDRPEHPNLSWVYLPQEKQGPANRITYMSNYSPGNAPEGKTSFLCEVTNRPDERCDPGVVDEVLAGMEWAGLLRRDEVLFTDSAWHRFAYIVYDHELDARRSASLAWCEEAGIVALGRFGHYDYHNSDQCVIAARAVAEELRAQAVRG